MIIQSLENFDEKMNRTKEAVYSIMGIPTGAEFLRKYLLKKEHSSSPSQKSIPINFAGFPDFEEIEVCVDYVDVSCIQRCVDGIATYVQSLFQ